jgi:hypothetical protein
MSPILYNMKKVINANIGPITGINNICIQINDKNIVILSNHLHPNSGPISFMVFLWYMRQASLVNPQNGEAINSIKKQSIPEPIDGELHIDCFSSNVLSTKGSAQRWYSNQVNDLSY